MGSPLDNPRAFLRSLYDAAVARALPERVMPRWLPTCPRGRTVVVGAGKAGGAMAQALDRLWPASAPVSGLVVTRYGHTPPARVGDRQRIEIVEASHPVPDAAGMRAARRMLDLVQGLGPDDLVVALISGGGSALLTLPGPGITLADKQEINRALLESGAQIGEMNCVRKHLSAIKGGRLAAACGDAAVVSLLISDVPGDDPAVIASGPTVPDPTTCADALAILKRYGIEVPPGVEQVLASGDVETPKPDDPRFSRHAVHIMATPRQALEAAADVARASGVAAHILGDDIEGESRDVGRMHAALARSIRRHGTPFARPCVLLSGGETTVTVRPRGSGPRGRGGRAAEFALGAALDLKAEPDVWLLAADTDGIDGTENNAGVIVTPETRDRGRALGMRGVEYLDRNDAWSFFDRLGDLVVTGPTYTNVNDFRAILIK